MAPRQKSRMDVISLSGLTIGFRQLGGHSAFERHTLQPSRRIGRRKYDRVVFSPGGASRVAHVAGDLNRRSGGNGDPLEGLVGPGKKANPLAIRADEWLDPSLDQQGRIEIVHWPYEYRRHSGHAGADVDDLRCVASDRDVLSA